MTNRIHHVFFSYARADNAEDNNHFITRFHDLLRNEHKAVTGRELKTFFDTEAIDEGERWKTRLGQGLRDSRLFVAFLSDNYLKSEVCRWEWEHYLLTEHTAARGEDGVVPLYFIPIDDLGKESEAQLAEWINEIKQRNLGAYCQLQPWYKAGRERARELDAAERADALRQIDVGSEEDLPLAERIRRLNLRICRRLDRIQLAEQVIGNVVRPYRHFVGRHQQLRELHEALTVDQTSLLATVHSPGGLGKSALSRQYAIAYADFYAAGGVWELKCANLTHLGDALRQLEQHKSLTEHGFSLEEDREKSSDQQAASALAQLKRITHERRDIVNQQLRDLKDRHTPEDQMEVRENSRCLLILDNVDDTAMLAADQLNLIPAEDWLSVIVTTRLSPDSFGAATSLKSIEVPPLSLAEGKELLRTFMPSEVFPDSDEEQAAEDLVKALDGYTIGLELIGASVSVDWQEGDRLSNHLEMLEDEGLASTDQLGDDSDVQKRIQYRHKQISHIVEDTLKTLRERLSVRHNEELAFAAQQLIEMASLLQPDTIPAPWLKVLLQQTHPDVKGARKRLEPWNIIRQALVRQSLLSPAERHANQDEAAADVLRIHRVTAAHIANQLAEGGEWHWQQIESYLDRLSALLELDSSFKTLDQRNRHQQWLIAQAAHLINKYPSAVMLRSLSIAAGLEGDHGSLSLAIELGDLIREHHEAILDRNPDSSEAARDLSISQDMLGMFHWKRGQPGDAERALGYYEASLETREELYRRNPDSAQAARDLSISQNNLGNFHLQRGQPDDAERALGYFETSLKIREDLHQRNPDSAQAARDLSLSQNNLCDFLLRRGQPGDAERALAYFEAALKIRQELHHRNPDSAQAARDLSVSQGRLGNFNLRRGQPGDGDRALGYFEASLKIREDLHQRNPDSPQAARALSISNNRLGSFHLKRGKVGDAEQALSYYEACHEMLEDLRRRNPDNVQAARDLSISQAKLGDFYLERGQPVNAERALGYYEASLGIREELYRRNPDSSEAARDLSVSQERLGDFLFQRGQPDDAERALGYYEASLGIREELYRRNPDSAQAARNLSASQEKLGDFHLKRSQSGDVKRALDYFQLALEILNELHRRNPVSAQLKSDLADVKSKLADLQSQ